MTNSIDAYGVIDHVSSVNTANSAGRFFHSTGHGGDRGNTDWSLPTDTWGKANFDFVEDSSYWTGIKWIALQGGTPEAGGLETGGVIPGGVIPGDVTAFDELGDQVAEIGNRVLVVAERLDSQIFTPENNAKLSEFVSDIASLAKRTIIIMNHEKRRFVEQVDYITSPGWKWQAGSPATRRPNAGPALSGASAVRRAFHPGEPGRPKHAKR